MPPLYNLFPGNIIQNPLKMPDNDRLAHDLFDRIVEAIPPEKERDIPLPEDNQNEGNWKKWLGILAGLAGGAAGGYGLYRLYRRMMADRGSQPPARAQTRPRTVTYSTTPLANVRVPDTDVRLIDDIGTGLPQPPRGIPGGESLIPNINFFESEPTVVPLNIRLLFDVNRFPVQERRPRVLLANFIGTALRKIDHDIALFEDFKEELRRGGWYERDTDLQLSFREPSLRETNAPYRIILLKTLSDYALEEIDRVSELSPDAIDPRLRDFFKATFVNLKNHLYAEHFDVFVKADRDMVMREFAARKQSGSKVLVVKYGKVMIERGGMFTQPDKQTLLYLSSLLKSETAGRLEALSRLISQMQPDRSSRFFAQNVPVEDAKTEMRREVERVRRATVQAVNAELRSNEAAFIEGRISGIEFSESLARYMKTIQREHGGLIRYLAENKELIQPNNEVVNFVAERAWQLRPSLLVRYEDASGTERRIISFDSFTKMQVAMDRNFRFSPDLNRLEALVISRYHHPENVSSHPISQNIMRLLRGMRVRR
jgi:hypothetical protein